MHYIINFVPGSLKAKHPTLSPCRKGVWNNSFCIWLAFFLIGPKYNDWKRQCQLNLNHKNTLHRSVKFTDFKKIHLINLSYCRPDYIYMYHLNGSYDWQKQILQNVKTVFGKILIIICVLLQTVHRLQNIYLFICVDSCLTDEYQIHPLIDTLKTNPKELLKTHFIYILYTTSIVYNHF